MRLGTWCGRGCIVSGESEVGCIVSGESEVGCVHIALGE